MNLLQTRCMFACALRTLLGTAVVLLLLLPATADAAPSRKKAIWGPIEVNGVSQFPIYHDLGVGIWETRLSWADVARTRPGTARDPSDPAYHWPPELDQAIAEGRRYGIRIAVVITESPRWASGHRRPEWAPRRPSDFADFAYATSRRYPTVRLWMIWSEPTRHENFKPMFRERRGRPLTRRMRRTPHLYARILDGAYQSLNQANPRNLVIGGNSFTTGDISALNWIKNLRLPNGRPPRLDMYGHNPFSARRPLLNRPPLGNGFADFSDLDLLARWVDRYLGRPRGRRRTKLFLSELFWPTDHANHEFNFWVTRRTAASWLSDALRVTRRWSRIYTLGWLSLYDDAPTPEGDDVHRGLLTHRGHKKPAYRAYKRG
jgi:hypothetical protein